MAHGKPLVGVSTLQGLAMNAGFFPGPVVPVLNAFRGELYFGIYRSEEGAPRAIQGDAVASVDEFLQYVSSFGGECLLLGNGLEICRSKISDPSKIHAVPELLNTPRASNIAYLAGGLKAEPESRPVLPRYLRKPG
jgi:tRNA threonylcarbamoyladenosine biosynthesis protein TsaB